MRVHAITLGCQMSAADGYDTVAALARLGWQRADTPEQADAIVLTTCSVRKHAEHRAISLIGRLRAWKAAAPGRMLVIAGCVAERLGPELTRRFPYVDLVVGARQAGRYPELIAAELNRRFAPAAIPAGSPCRAPSGNILAPSTATVTIMRGCDCACSYCIVPSVRGPETCRPPEDILAEVRAKVAAGAREVTLLGQRVNAYRFGRDGKTTDFPTLLRAVDRTEGLARLRFMS
ncbi:MAG: radical SAM protein, partial [Elusimicrobiota bacterium]